MNSFMAYGKGAPRALQKRQPGLQLRSKLSCAVINSGSHLAQVPGRLEHRKVLLEARASIALQASRRQGWEKAGNPSAGWGGVSGRAKSQATSFRGAAGRA